MYTGSFLQEFKWLMEAGKGKETDCSLGLLEKSSPTDNLILAQLDLHWIYDP
jgi:hypothetical protein